METPDAAAAKTTVVVETGEEVEIVALETCEAVETVEVETGEAPETVEMNCYSETQCIPFAIEW